jgi:ankyrin repeat protein
MEVKMEVKRNSFVNKIKVNEIFKKKDTSVKLTDEQIKEQEKKDEEEMIRRNKIELEHLKLELENKDFKINSQLRDGRTPIYVSTCNGNLEAVKYLVEKGADTEIKEYENGNTPLMAAITLGYTDIIVYLISKNANIHAKNNNGDTPILFAALLGNMRLIMFLHQLGADINHKNNENISCILFAVGNVFFDIFKYLINNNAELDVIDCDRKHFFDLLIERKNIREIDECREMMIRYLHVHSMIKEDYETALLMAIFMKNTSKAIELIETKHADYKKMYSNKSSILHYVVLFNNIKLIEYLVDFKYDLNIPSLLHFCVDQNNDYILNQILKRTTKMINQYDKDYICTPLVRAVLCNKLQTAEILLMYSAKPNICVPGNYSALYFAIMSQNYEMVKMLVDYGADVNNCLRPYSLSSIHGNEMKGDSMLRYAMRCWNRDIIKLLESKNAIIQSEY